MSFELNSEQEEFKSTVSRFLKDYITPEYLRARIDSNFESDGQFWSQIAELGFEEYFWDEGTFTELAIIAEISGQVLLPEPLVDRLFAGPYLHRSNGQVKEQAFAVCLLDQEIKSSDKNINFDGQTVAGASDASHIVCIGTDNTVADAVLSDKSLTKDLLQGLDKVCDLSTLSASKLPVECFSASQEYPAIMYRLLKCMELSGICRQVVVMTKEYVGTRKQFGRAIGSFQAVRHKLVDMYLASEALEALCLFAVWSAEHSKEQFPLAALSAIDYACSHSSELIEAAIQLHGGIGFTWEFDLHLFLRRAKSYEILYGLAEREQEVLLDSALNS